MRLPEWFLITDLRSRICDLISVLINSLATVDQFVSYMAMTAARRHSSD